jgi:hypothetical protein
VAARSDRRGRRRFIKPLNECTSASPPGGRRLSGLHHRAARKDRIIFGDPRTCVEKS